MRTLSLVTLHWLVLVGCAERPAGGPDAGLVCAAPDGATDAQGGQDRGDASFGRHHLVFRPVTLGGVFGTTQDPWPCSIIPGLHVGVWVFSEGALVRFAMFPCADGTIDVAGLNPGVYEIAAIGTGQPTNLSYYSIGRSLLTGLFPSSECVASPSQPMCEPLQVEIVADGATIVPLELQCDSELSVGSDPCGGA